MRTPLSTITLDDQPAPVRLKIAAAWTSFMFLYVYVDVLGFYKPGHIDDILDGQVFTFDITQTWAVTVLALLTVPITMVVASATLPARRNRAVNLIVVALYVPFTAFNALGDTWTIFFSVGVVLELILLALITRWAWTWPRTTPTATRTSNSDRNTLHVRQA